MRLFSFEKDGGPKSRVYGLFFIEWKALFSIVLLNFRHGSREAYHSHAFNCISWVLWGRLEEHREFEDWEGTSEKMNVFRPSIFPIITTRDNFHKVISSGNTWVISFRGPWVNRWRERKEDGREVTLTHGRVEV